MADMPEISVIIVSRDRPDDLRKMLSCLRFQDISGFEVIVVTNTPGALEGASHPTPLRLFDCDEANIAVARNVGIFAAKGRFIAFCDDDALPDPSWLGHLLAPFKNPAIGGTGGFTRGRNGISLQWGAVETDLVGVAHPLDIAADSKAEIFAPSQKTAPVMIGTNCAFRASALKQIGGFDPAFAYYLDDSDISLRLSQAGWKLAIVPRAQVHHGFAAGPYRAQNRVPKTLHPHGKSLAVFCRKHAPEGALEPALAAFTALQFKRLEKQLLAGLMEPPALPALIKSLEDGYQTGRYFLLKSMPVGKKPAAGQSPILELMPRTHVLLVGRKADQKWLADTGKTLADGGIITTTLILSRSPAFMKANFSADGYWTLSGGQFGKSARREPLLQKRSFYDKVQAEVQRLAGISPVDYVAFPQRPAQAAIFSPQNAAMSCLNGFVVESV
ncbi:MAG TPA: glycosyltransferase family 2 protein [Rhodobacteraceae bacterium]|nr:glycosyltransferase family 2 protein [Paracoccaceae bacterium]